MCVYFVGVLCFGFIYQFLDILLVPKYEEVIWIDVCGKILSYMQRFIVYIVAKD